MYANISNITEYRTDSAVLQNFLFLYLVFIMGAIIRHAAFVMKMPIPYTVLVFVLGMAAGGIFYNNKSLLSVGPHVQLNAFMPVLIFEGAFAMDVYVFRKVFWQSLLLAGPGLVVMIGMTATVATMLLNWNWYWSLLFGSVVSATDPVAVVALLKDIGASQHLTLLIEGESMLNDGTAMVGFYTIFQIMTGQTELRAWSVMRLLVRFAGGGPLFGYLVAYVSLLWLSRTFNDPLAEIAITVLAAYLCFFVSETMLDVSGVLALVVLGIVLSNNRTAISPEVEEFLHSFWETLAYLANTLIFFLVGMTIVQSVIHNLKPNDFVYLALIYVSVNAIRGISIMAFSPFMRRLAYGLPWQYTIVSTWSGLRGAVGLALALIVYHSEHFVDKKHITYQILFQLSGIVFISLVVNATTVSKLLEILGMSGVSNARKMSMKTALSYMADATQRTISVWKTDRFLASVDWEFVEQQCAVSDPFHEEMTKEELEADIDITERVWAQCPHCGVDVPYQPTRKELADMTAEAIIRLIKAERLSYWRQFEQGMLATDALRKLTELCDTAADRKGQFVSTEFIKEQWEYPGRARLLMWVKRQDIPRIYWEEQKAHFTRTESCNILHKPLKEASCLLKVLTNRWVVISIAVILYLVLDLPITILTLTYETHVLGSYDRYGILMTANTIVLALMTTYFVARTMVLKSAYRRTPWFGLSVIIIVHGTLDELLLMTLPLPLMLQGPGYPGDGTGSGWVRTLSVCLRFVRQLHALEALVPLLILLMDDMLSKHLSSGYDVGRGFVLGEEEVRNVIELMSDRREIVEHLRTHCDNAKFEILKCLGLLQKQHPEVAMGVKTHRAIRSVLNQLRMGIHTLQQEGVLEEAEGSELATIIESKMKKLLTAPPKVPLASIEKILRNVPWISDNDALVQFIKSRARLVNYEYGQEMMTQGEPTTGLSIILSGLVKLELTAQIIGRAGQPEQATRILDFLTSGNVLGEMGVLTGNPRSATVKCETAVQVLELDFRDIEDAFEKFSDISPPLKIRLWRLGAVRLATGVVMDKPAFQTMTKEQIRMLLECGSVHEIDVMDGEVQFLVNASAAEVVLLFGTAFDSYSHERYDGPCYIPPKTIKLIFQRLENQPNPVLYVLPRHFLLGDGPMIVNPRTSLKPDNAAAAGSERSDNLSRLCLSVVNMQYASDPKKSVSAITNASVKPTIHGRPSVFMGKGKQRRISPMPTPSPPPLLSRSLNLATMRASAEAIKEMPMEQEEPLQPIPTARTDDSFQVHGETSASVESVVSNEEESSDSLSSTESLANWQVGRPPELSAEASAVSKSPPVEESFREKENSAVDAQSIPRTVFEVTAGAGQDVTIGTGTDVPVATTSTAGTDSLEGPGDVGSEVAPTVYVLRDARQEVSRSARMTSEEFATLSISRVKAASLDTVVPVRSSSSTPSFRREHTLEKTSRMSGVGPGGLLSRAVHSATGLRKGVQSFVDRLSKNVTLGSGASTTTSSPEVTVSDQTQWPTFTQPDSLPGNVPQDSTGSISHKSQPGPSKRCNKVHPIDLVGSLTEILKTQSSGQTQFSSTPTTDNISQDFTSISPQKRFPDPIKKSNGVPAMDQDYKKYFADSSGVNLLKDHLGQTAPPAADLYKASASKETPADVRDSLSSTSLFQRELKSLGGEQVPSVRPWQKRSRETRAADSGTSVAVKLSKSDEPTILLRMASRSATDATKLASETKSITSYSDPVVSETMTAGTLRSKFPFRKSSVCYTETDALALRSGMTVTSASTYAAKSPLTEKEVPISDLSSGYWKEPEKAQERDSAHAQPCISPADVQESIATIETETFSVTSEPEDAGKASFAMESVDARKLHETFKPDFTPSSVMTATQDTLKEASTMMPGRGQAGGSQTKEDISRREQTQTQTFGIPFIQGKGKHIVSPSREEPDVTKSNIVIPQGMSSSLVQEDSLSLRARIYSVTTIEEDPDMTVSNIVLPSGVSLSQFQDDLVSQISHISQNPESTVTFDSSKEQSLPQLQGSSASFKRVQFKASSSHLPDQSVTSMGLPQGQSLSQFQDSSASFKQRKAEDSSTRQEVDQPMSAVSPVDQCSHVQDSSVSSKQERTLDSLTHTGAGLSDTSTETSKLHVSSSIQIGRFTVSRVSPEQEQMLLASDSSECNLFFSDTSETEKERIILQRESKRTSFFNHKQILETIAEKSNKSGEWLDTSNRWLSSTSSHEESSVNDSCFSESEDNSSVKQASLQEVLTNKSVCTSSESLCPEHEEQPVTPTDADQTVSTDQHSGPCAKTVTEPETDNNSTLREQTTLSTSAGQTVPSDKDGLTGMCVSFQESISDTINGDYSCKNGAHMTDLDEENWLIDEDGRKHMPGAYSSEDRFSQSMDIPAIQEFMTPRRESKRSSSILHKQMLETILEKSTDKSGEGVSSARNSGSKSSDWPDGPIRCFSSSSSGTSSSRISGATVPSDEDAALGKHVSPQDILMDTLACISSGSLHTVQTFSPTVSGQTLTSEKDSRDDDKPCTKPETENTSQTEPSQAGMRAAEQGSENPVDLSPSLSQEAFGRLLEELCTEPDEPSRADESGESTPLSSGVHGKRI